eukprot:9942-Eustigmatos_ZCMA.PRE.1
MIGLKIVDAAQRETPHFTIASLDPTHTCTDLQSLFLHSGMGVEGPPLPLSVCVSVRDKRSGKSGGFFALQPWVCTPRMMDDVHPINTQ